MSIPEASGQKRAVQEADLASVLAPRAAPKDWKEKLEAALKNAHPATGDGEIPVLDYEEFMKLLREGDVAGVE